jgi:predicted ATPase
VKILLSGTVGELNWWKDSINAAISPNGQVLIDVIPQIEAIIGPQNPVPFLSPTENKIRFESVMVSFLIVLLFKYTIMLFIDDMQWAGTNPNYFSMLQVT